MDRDCLFLASNATLQARLTAGARYERTLLAVACKRLFGSEHRTTFHRAPPCFPSYCWHISPNYSSTWEIGQRKYMWRQDEPHVDRIPRPSYS